MITIRKDKEKDKEKDEEKDKEFDCLHRRHSLPPLPTGFLCTGGHQGSKRPEAIV